MAGDNLPAELEQALHGPHNSNGALSTATRQGLFNLKADRPLSSRQDYDAFNVRYTASGGTVTRAPEAYELATDGTQSGSRSVLESARLGVYRAGVENEAALGVWIPDRPTGDGEIRIGYLDDRLPQDGLYHRITSDDWQAVATNRNAGTVQVSRSAGHWDQGTVTEHEDSEGNLVGKSYGLVEDSPAVGARDWDPAWGYIYGVTIGWYGPLSSLFWVDAITNDVGEWRQSRQPLVLYRPLYEPSFTVPNRPLHLSVDNGTTAEQVRAQVAGRQFSIQGNVDPSPEPVWQDAIGQELPMDGTGFGANDWYPVAVFRRKDGNEGVASGLEEIEVAAPNESLAVHARLVDPQYLTNVSYTGPDDVSATQTSLEFDIQEDTTTRVTVDEWTDTNDGDKVKVQGIGFRGDHIGTGAKNEATTGNLSGDLAFPIVRQIPTVVFARTRSGTSDTCDVIGKFIEVGS